MKRNEDGVFSIGPYSRHFKIVPLSSIVEMIEWTGVLKGADIPEIKEWYAFLKYEKQKRDNYLNMLKRINEFRLLYLGSSGLTDWPNNRINICLPEILLFFYSMIAQTWNQSQYIDEIGRVAVYPIGRMGKVDDAILNFAELWARTTFTLNGLIESKNAIYFEFNEDFNLHLKIQTNYETEHKIDEIFHFIEKRDAELSLNQKYNSTPERYKQGNYVLYEWDLQILDNIDDLTPILSKSYEVISNAMAVLK